MVEIVLLRHGQSIWNLENRFTGWMDVDLSETGYKEARAAGRTLKENGFSFDIAFTSLLKRAIRTLWIVLEELDLLWIPVEKSWRLNERHYGALQGLNKSETAARHSEEQVLLWRRSYDVPPPPLDVSDERYPGYDPKYQKLSSREIPRTESLKDTVSRCVPYWEETIAPTLREGKKAIIVAHGNSLRALLMHLQNLTPQEVLHLNIPTGIPLVLTLDKNLKYVSQKYLGNPEEVESAIAAVAAQAKA